MPTAHTRKHGYRHLLLLAALLLFLPFAQAQHLAGHGLIAGDVHCQVCHSSVDLEGSTSNNQLTIINLPANEPAPAYGRPAFVVLFNPITPIRAPPVNL